MMRLQHATRMVLLLSIAIFACTNAWAQVTTATLTGLITDTNGEPLVGVSVAAEHQPSGTWYGTATRNDGRYTIPNMRIGGPYTVKVSYTGYKETSQDNISLNLAQKLTVNFKMEESGININEVVVEAERNAILNGQRTGASTNIGNDQIQRLPTISRSAADYYRLTPQSDGGSFAGRNDQFNNFSLDGTIFNNPFGLDAATPGGQTDAQPISLDAIEQIQVALAPYDVTQSGFTGAAINAVTKSGTNTLKGTVFGFYRNQDMIGSKVNGDDSPVPDITQGQYGFSLGGPLVKNKLFFFVNAEIERRQDLGTAGFVASRPGVTGANVSRVSAEDFEAVATALRKLGYDPGAYENYKHNTYNNKAIIKLDYNINKNHKFTVTGNWLDAFKQKPAHPSAIGRRGPDATTLQFENSGYRINNKIYSGVAELKSSFGTRVSNKLQAGYTAFRDTRDPRSTPFPVVNINKDGIRYIVAGHEPFSINNVLDQDALQVNDAVNIYLDKNTVTVGFAFEKFMFNNSFNLNAYGGTFGPGFESVQAFVDSVNTGVFNDDVAAAQAAFAAAEQKGIGVPGGWALAETNVGQFGLFLQDEISLFDNLNLTLGMRMDVPLYFDTKTKIEENLARNCCYVPDVQYYDEKGNPVLLDSKQLPRQRPLFSPRIGINWDVFGDRSTQVRGGSGLFTGRFPFVWISNQVANPNFFFYNTTAPNFKFPQVFRSSLGVDHKFGKGWIISLDAIHTRDLNAMMVRNYGLKQPSGRLKGVDNRPIYVAADRTVPFANNAYVFTNADEGRTINLTAQLQRNWSNDFYTSLAYNFGLAEDVSSIEAEISSDAYDRNPAYGNVNQAVLSNSLYGNRHRVVGVLSKKITYGRMATTVSTIFQYAQGGRYSYVYSGDLNNDGSGLNDLILVPTDAQVDLMVFSGTADQQNAQKAALKAYIAQDEYLSDNRGSVAEKYATLSPWYNNWDVRILQDLNIKGSNNIQLSIDIINAGNLVSSKWGVRQIPTNNQPIGVSVDAAGNPTYSFPLDLKSTFTPDPSFLSRWQAQVGLRYSF